MSSFRKTLMEAKEGNQDSIVALYNQYRPLMNHMLLTHVLGDDGGGADD